LATERPSQRVTFEAAEWTDACVGSLGKTTPGLPGKVRGLDGRKRW
jgi:hypothetical protein